MLILFYARKSWVAFNLVNPAVTLRGDIFGSCVLPCVVVAVIEQSMMIMDSWEWDVDSRNILPEIDGICVFDLAGL